MTTPNDFLISRVINAPKVLVFNAWADPKQIVLWWGPPTVTNTITVMDVKAGGAYRIVMLHEGIEYPIKGVFREVIKPERLVMTMDCSEHPAEWQNLVKPDRKKGEDNPAGQMLETVTFEDQNNKTKLTVRITFDSSEIRDSMLKMGMNEGWSLSLDRLGDHLVKMMISK
jgi:uncharacterized protein YndB with AHSA1/START domain